MATAIPNLIDYDIDMDLDVAWIDNEYDFVYRNKKAASPDGLGSSSSQPANSYTNDLLGLSFEEEAILDAPVLANASVNAPVVTPANFTAPTTTPSGKTSVSTPVSTSTPAPAATPAVKSFKLGSAEHRAFIERRNAKRKQAGNSNGVDCHPLANHPVIRRHIDEKKLKQLTEKLIDIEENEYEKPGNPYSSDANNVDTGSHAARRSKPANYAPPPLRRTIDVSRAASRAATPAPSEVSPFRNNDKKAGNKDWFKATSWRKPASNKRPPPSSDGSISPLSSPPPGFPTRQSSANAVAKASSKSVVETINTRPYKAADTNANREYLQALGRNPAPPLSEVPGKKKDATGRVLGGQSMFKKTKDGKPVWMSAYGLEREREFMEAAARKEKEVLACIEVAKEMQIEKIMTGKGYAGFEDPKVTKRRGQFRRNGDKVVAAREGAKVGNPFLHQISYDTS